MLNKKTQQLILLGVSSLFIIGCAGKQEQTPPQNSSQGEPKQAYYEASKFRLKPIIGSRNDDARTVVDMGTLLKIWVAPYKGRNGVLTASHDAYAWAKMPDFIVGEEVPTTPSVENSSGMVFNNRLPASLSAEEVDRTNIQNDENIQTFVNGLDQFVKKEKAKEEETTKSEEKIKSSKTKVDQEILDFIKTKNGEKGKNAE